MQLDYPVDKLKIVFITDGSTDDSLEILKKHPHITTLHINRRGGKTAAENRAMKHVTTPYVIFSDANTFVNKQAVRSIVRHFADEKVGCVAGEKRILTKSADVASAAGEGMYWKYESFLKKLDTQLYSAVGAAGELVAFKTNLYENMPEDTILDDFIQSMTIACKGYKIVYEPDAYAVETAAASVKEELKERCVYVQVAGSPYKGSAAVLVYANILSCSSSMSRTAYCAGRLTLFYCWLCSL